MGIAAKLVSQSALDVNGNEVVWALIDTLIAGGWTKEFESDGSSGPVESAADLNNADAYVVLQQPAGGDAPFAGSRQWGIQRGSNANEYRVRLSQSGTLAGGSATAMPTSADQQWVSNQGGTYDTWFSAVGEGTEVDYHIVVFDADDGFSFFLAMHHGSVNFETCVAMDACRSRVPADEDPFVYAAGGQMERAVFSDDAFGAYAFVQFGTGGQSWEAVHVQIAADAEPLALFPGLTDNPDHLGYWTLGPAFYGDPNVEDGETMYKGTSTIFRLATLEAATSDMWQLEEDGPPEFLQWSDLALLWDAETDAGGATRLAHDITIESSGGGDIVPPVVTYDPTDSSTLARRDFVHVHVTDNVEVADVTISVEYPGSGLWEIAYAEGRFSAGYAENSTKSGPVDDLVFDIQPPLGWTRDVMVHTTALDLDGNETIESASYSVAAAPAAEAAPADDGLPKEIEHNTSHIAEGLDRLIEQYKKKPRIQDFLTAVLAQVQEIEDMLWDVLVKRFIDNAVDEQLLMIGRIVGQPNPGYDLSDHSPGGGSDKYRTLIMVKIKVNRSSGRAPQLIEILKLIAGETSEIFYSEDYPKAANLSLETASGTVDPDLTISLLDKAKPIGTRLTFTFSTFDEDESFIPTNDDDTTVSTTQGLTDDGDTDGGYLSNERG